MALKKRYFLALTSLFFIPCMAFATAWKIVPDKSSLSFTATQNNAPATGNFSSFSGTINFDPNNLTESNVNIVVDMTSVSASYKEISDTLKTSEWFNIKTYPTAVFNATKFHKLDENKYQADGTLTIRDKSIPTSLVFTLEKYSRDSALAKGTVELKRSLFDVGIGQWASTDSIKDEVTVNFVIAATP